MRLIDMQVSVNGTAPGGHQVAQAQALYTYRFLHDIEQARKTNLQRQESAQPAAATAASEAVSDQVPVHLRKYANRVKRDDQDSGRKGSSEKDHEYSRRERGHSMEVMPQFIDFSA